MISPLLSRVPGVVHEFGSIAAPTPLAVMPGWLAAKAQWKQVHGTACLEVPSPALQGLEADAFYTFAQGVPVAVTHADCVPILLARRDGGAVAAVHAGWRGTRARILRELWRRLAARGERPADWVAAVGPAIGPCCYEVSPELAADFATEFGREHGAALVIPRERHLDLPAVNAAELRAIGAGEVELLRACTRCSTDPSGEPLFHSYRREGKAWPMYSAIATRPAQ